VTEQGEMIQAKFGLPGIALRTLEVYTTGTLEATLTTPPPVEPAWRQTMTALAARHARRSAAPSTTIRAFPRISTPPPRKRSSMICTSAAARRGDRQAAADVAARDSLAVCVDADAPAPGVMARAEELVSEVLSDTDRARCREMYRVWPFFRSMVDLSAMALAKADPAIAAHYDRHLVPAELQPLGEELRARLAARRPPSWPSRVTAGCSKTTPCCDGRSTCAIRTSIRSIWCRWNSCGASAR
jgi:phosphoenolpyruvate carboxylase